MESLMQVGALPLRRGKNNTLEVLLVTSRGTARWVIPKGWPGKRLTDPDAAAREAVEEAGVVGRIGDTPIGHYTYFKRQTDGFRLSTVAVYPLSVTDELKEWPEREQRRRAWFPLARAAHLVQEPSLKTLIEHAKLSWLRANPERQQRKRRKAG